ncbi:MAG: MmcQ/YjbR family DNA-binding protein [Alphaproteobacteria bacterium]|nr:MmcQ/YjbR family DNA-binding protein [Alphaproteobacteria bacterium]
MRHEIINFIDKKYGVRPEYLWRKYPNFCVFRHGDNKKWFGLCATIPRSYLKLVGDGNVDVINLKTDNVDFLLGVRGVLPAYHMNKNHWVSVLLDGTVSAANVKKLIQMSYDLTKP